jgi:hypothetical protein
MDTQNSFISIYGLIIATMSGGMMWAGYNMVVKDECDDKRIARQFIGGSLLVGGIYVFLPSAFRTQWIGAPLTTTTKYR